MSEEQREERETTERLKAWAVVLLLVAFILLYGAIVYRFVGDKGPPGWDFGTVQDVPGQSPYSTEKLK